MMARHLGAIASLSENPVSVLSTRMVKPNCSSRRIQFLLPDSGGRSHECGIHMCKHSYINKKQK